MKACQTVLSRLNDAGKEGFLVGGCVRDLLLNKEPHDFDVTTDALPGEIKEIFASFRTIDTGLKHGTVTVMVDGEPVEVTTYRVDGGYTDRRHPDKVLFSSELCEDLARRDFTVNAMAMDQSGRITDPFGGREDLEKKIIRCVGDPSKRFSEDALRILRALRFSSVLGFEIEENTKKSAAALAPTLTFVSRERCFSELKKMLCGENFGKVFLENKEVISALLPPFAGMYGFDQNNPHHAHTLDLHTALTISYLPPDPVLRLAALFHDVGKLFTEAKDEQGISHFYGHAQKSAEIAEKELLDLKSDNKTRSDVVFLVDHHDAPYEQTKQQILKKLNRYGERRYRLLLALRKADNQAQGVGFPRSAQQEFCERTLKEIESEREKDDESCCFSMKDLALNGSDLIAAGIPEGKQVGSVLAMLLDEVMSGKTENKKETLLKRARDWMEESGNRP